LGCYDGIKIEERRDLRIQKMLKES